MNTFTQKVNEYIATGNTYLEKIRDMRLDFHFAIMLISEYFPVLFSAAVENTCGIEISSSSKWVSDTNRLRIQYFNEEENTLYMVTLSKSTSIRDGTRGGRARSDPYEDSCTLLMSTIDMSTGEVMKNCAIMALPSYKKEYEHKPCVYLDRMLKCLLAKMSENELCYLYLADSSAKNFFEFKIDDNRGMPAW